jgi:predicted enzyme related to lactoylglutathione lyase
MSERKWPTEGRFVWYELATKDKDKALKFYQALLGWNVHTEDMGELGQYPMIGVGEAWLGGVVTLKDDKLPPHWMAYVTVPDVDAAAVKAEELGGKVLVPPTDIPNVGRFAAIADPQGAVLLPFKSIHPDSPETEGPPPAGHFCWNELLTTDPAAASNFYRDIFGWEITTQEMGETGTYWLCQRGSKMECGLMQMPAQAEAPPHWLPYVAVTDVDAAVKKCQELGGMVYCQPTNIPDMGRFAVMADDQGGIFAVFAGQK